MNKNIKIFGISAAALLVLVAIGPCIANETKASTPTIQPYIDLATRYQTEFNELQAYMDSWFRTFGTMEGIRFTQEQEIFLHTYAIQVQQIYFSQGIPQYQHQGRFWGLNGIYDSINTVPGPDGNNHFCRMFLINHNLTKFWGDLVWNLGFLRAYITIGAILFIILGMNDFDEWLAIMAFIWSAWTVIRDYLQLYQGQSGAEIFRWFGWGFLPMNQPLNGYIPNCWIYLNGKPIPNPAIWTKLYPQ